LLTVKEIYSEDLSVANALLQKQLKFLVLSFVKSNIRRQFYFLLVIYFDSNFSFN